MTGQVRLVPKRRFKEYQNTNDWEQRRLYENVDIIGTGKSKFTSNIQITEGKPYVVLGSTSVISYDNEYDYSGDFILTARVGANAGELYRYSGNVKISDNTVFLQGKNLDFIFYSLTKFNLKNLAFGTGQPLIKASELSNIELMFPSRVEEQIKIGDLFKQLDHLITLHQRKLEKTKALKAAYLSEMFPAEGEREPKRRFTGFTVPWEQRKLGEVADIIGGGTPSTSNEKYWNGDIDWYSPVEIGEQTYVNSSQKKITSLGLQKSSAKILPIGAVLFTSRAGIGNTAILAKEGATNQGFQSIVPHENKLDSYFIYSRTHELKSYGETNGAGSTFVEVSGKQMAQMPMFLPKIEEQKAIGDFFKQLDNLITLHQRKLEKLQRIKKAYLYEMFI